MTLTGAAGLFLLAGAEFLAVATLVVYAGAILVTFLFVLMLAQPEGHMSYDRRSWEAMVLAFTGAALVGVLTMMIVAAITHGNAPGTAIEPPGGEAAAVAAAPGAEHAAPTISQLGAVLFTATWWPSRRPGHCSLWPWWGRR